MTKNILIGILVLVTLVSLVFALFQKIEASKQRVAAEINMVMAMEAQKQAETQMQLAAEQQKRAQEELLKCKGQK